MKVYGVVNTAPWILNLDGGERSTSHPGGENSGTGGKQESNRTARTMWRTEKSLNPK
jgi:hypothetical protein